MTLSLSANTLYKEIFRKKRHISKIPIMKIINFNISKSIKFLKQVQLFWRLNLPLSSLPLSQEIPTKDSS